MLSVEGPGSRRAAGRLPAHVQTGTAMTQQQIGRHAQSPRLARLMDLDGSGEGACSPDELGHILRYRLSLPVDPAGADSADSADPLTFADALGRVDVTLEVLRRVKEFAEA